MRVKPLKQSIEYEALELYKLTYFYNNTKMAQAAERTSPSFWSRA